MAEVDQAKEYETARDEAAEAYKVKMFGEKKVYSKPNNEAALGFLAGADWAWDKSYTDRHYRESYRIANECLQSLVKNNLADIDRLKEECDRAIQTMQAIAWPKG